MSDEKKESSINVEDLPQPEQKLTGEQAKSVQGGAGTTKANSAKSVWQEDFAVKGTCAED